MAAQRRRRANGPLPLFRPLLAQPSNHHACSVLNMNENDTRPSAKHIGIVSRLCVRLLMVPASFCLADSVSGWLRLQRRDWFFWQEFALEYRMRLRAKWGITRQCVGLCAFAASAIIGYGGIAPLAARALHFFFHEGISGLRARCSRQRLPVAASCRPGPAPPPNRILVSDSRIPRPDSSAGDFTTMGILRDMVALGYDVVFLPEDFEPTEPYCRDVQALGVRVVTRRDAYAGPDAYIASEGASFALFYCIRLQVAEALLPVMRAVSPRTTVLFHTPDLAWLREERQIRIEGKGGADATMKRLRELTVMKQADAVIVVSPVEKALLEKEIPPERVLLFPALYTPVLEDVPGFAARKDIFFLGGFSHPPNSDAAVWFAQTIWPHLYARLPEARLRIIGAEPTREVRDLSRLPGVRVEGYVRDLAPLLKELRVGVAPLRFGAGIKGKVAVTLGAGIPCVCSPVAAEGMDLACGCAFLVAGSEAEYVEKLLRIYRDERLWHELSREGIALVKTHFGIETCSRCLREILSEFSAPFSPEEDSDRAGSV